MIELIIGIIITLVFGIWQLILYFRSKKKVPEEVKELKKEVEKLKEVIAYLDGWSMLPHTDKRRITFDSGIKAMKGYYWDSAIEIFRSLLFDAKNGYKVSLLNLIGNCFYHKGELEQALGHYKESLILARKIKDKEGETANLSNIGIIYGTKGELDKALEYHKEALKINREIDRKEGIAANLGNIGLIYKTKGEKDKALNYLNQALMLFKQIGAKMEIEQTENNIRALQE